MQFVQDGMFVGLPIALILLLYKLKQDLSVSSEHHAEFSKIREGIYKAPPG